MAITMRHKSVVEGYRGVEGRWQHTSIQASSFMSESSLECLLLPFTAWRLLGGPISSAPLMAGRFLSSILAREDRGGEDLAEDRGIKNAAIRVDGKSDRNVNKKVGAEEIDKDRCQNVCMR